MKDEKYFTVKIILFLIVLITSGGIMYFVFNQQKSDLPIPKIENDNYTFEENTEIDYEEKIKQCNKITDTPYHDSCLLSLVEKYDLYQLCEDISSQENQDDCFYSAATLTYNIEYCNKISDYENRNDCVGEVGVSNNSEETCDSISSKYYRDPCYRDLAEKIGNPINTRIRQKLLIILINLLFNFDPPIKTLLLLLTSYITPSTAVLIS